MFHLMLVLPVLAPLLAVYGVIAGILVCLPFWAGIALQAVLTAVTKRGGWLLYLPGGLGLVCALGYFAGFQGLIPLWFQFLYWAVFYLCLWLTWFLVDRLRSWILRRMGRE